MFLLNGRPLSPDVAFRDSDGVQYPANWLRCASLEEKQAVGIEEVPDPVQVDQRYYWDNGLPKDLKPLQDAAIDKVKEDAGRILSNPQAQYGDWKIVKCLERGEEVPAWILEARQSVRDISNEIEADILAATTVEDLIAIDKVIAEPDAAPAVEAPASTEEGTV